MAKSESSKVAVIAYCANNLGDDLFLTQLVNRYKRARFDFFAESFEQLKAVNDNPRIGLTDDRKFRQNAEKYSALIVIGGSMFQEVGRWHRQFMRYAIRFMTARAAGVPVIIMGASFGPVNTELFQFSYRQLFKIAAWVSVRDELSANRLAGLDSVRRFPDIALGQDLVEPSAQRSPDVVGLSLVEFGSSTDHERYVLACRVLVEQLTDAHTVRIFSFQRTSRINDRRVADNVLSGLSSANKEKIEFIEYDGSNLIEVIEMVSTCRYFVASRFHSAIVALSLAVPLTAIAYHEKVASGLQSIDRRLPVVAPTALSSSAERIIKDISETGGEDERLQDLILNARAESSRHFDMLDSVLLKSN